MTEIRQHELGQVLMLALEDFQRRLDSELSAGGFPGIRRRHRAVFMHLNTHGASRSVDLAAAAGIRPQSMMKIVHELEQLGLVTRKADPSDSRAKLVEYSEQGERLLTQLMTSTEVVWEQYEGILGAPELRRMMASLRSLISHNKSGE